MTTLYLQSMETALCRIRTKTSLGGSGPCRWVENEPETIATNVPDNAKRAESGISAQIATVSFCGSRRVQTMRREDNGESAKVTQNFELWKRWRHSAHKPHDGRATEPLTTQGVHQPLRMSSATINFLDTQLDVDSFPGLRSTISTDSSCNVS